MIEYCISLTSSPLILIVINETWYCNTMWLVPTISFIHDYASAGPIRIETPDDTVCIKKNSNIEK